MKKIVIIMLMFCIGHSLFCSTYVSSKQYDDFDKAAKGLMGGGIAMMAVTVLPVTGMSLACIVSGSLLSLYFLEIFHTPLIALSQLGGAGGMMLYLGIKKYNNFYESLGNLSTTVMRNAGIIILATSSIPIAAASVFGAYIFSTYSAEEFLNGCDIKLAFFVVDAIMAVAQLACGIGFLSGGLYNEIFWKKQIHPEVAMIRNGKSSYEEGYKIHLGLRVQL